MEYSSSDIERMRHDALRRTREMHSHAQRKTQHAEHHTKHEEKKEHNQPVKETSSKECNLSSQAPKNENAPLNNILSGLSGMLSGNKIDNDRLIIIMLIILLAKEGADLKLLIALGYILM